MRVEELDSIVKEYPTVKFNDFSISIDRINNGIVFLYAIWSQSLIQLRILLNSLEEHKSIPLFIYDIDDPLFFEFKSFNNISSDGWGETFWIKSGQIIASKKKYLIIDKEELVKYNKLVSER